MEVGSDQESNDGRSGLQQAFEEEFQTTEGAKTKKKVSGSEKKE